jgi:hypothetical protein
MDFMPTLLHNIRCSLDSAEPATPRKFVVENWNLSHTLNEHSALFRRLIDYSQPSPGLA